MIKLGKQSALNARLDTRQEVQVRFIADHVEQVGIKRRRGKANASVVKKELQIMKLGNQIALHVSLDTKRHMKARLHARHVQQACFKIRRGKGNASAVQQDVQTTKPDNQSAQNVRLDLTPQNKTPVRLNARHVKQARTKISRDRKNANFVNQEVIIMKLGNHPALHVRWVSKKKHVARGRAQSVQKGPLQTQLAQKNVNFANLAFIATQANPPALHARLDTRRKHRARVNARNVQKAGLRKRLARLSVLSVNLDFTQMKRELHNVCHAAWVSL